MSTKKIMCGLVVGLCLGAAPAAAQDHSRGAARAAQRPAQSQAQAPRAAAGRMAADAPAEVRGMGGLIGTWEGTGTARMGTQSSNIHFRWACDAASGGYAVRCAFSMTGIPGMASYEETDLMGWNPNDRLYHWYSVTNAGEVHDHWGSCDGTTTTFQFQGMVDGKLFVERIAMVVDGARLRFHAVTTEGSAETSVLDGNATRR